MKMRKLLAGIAAAATLLGCAALGTASASADGNDATIIAVNAQQGSTYTAYKFAAFSNIQGDGAGAIKSVDVSTVATGDYLNVIVAAAKDAKSVADIPSEYKDNVAAYVATFTGSTLRKFASYVQQHIGDARNIGDFQGGAVTTDPKGSPTDQTITLNKGEGWYLVTKTTTGESTLRSVAVVASTISGYQTMTLSKDDGQNNIVELGKFNVKEENAPNAPHKYVYDGKMCDADEEIKDNTPNLDGKSVNVGDTLCYVVVTNVPKGAQGYTPYQMVIEDTASKGLTVDTSSVRAYHGNMAGEGIKMNNDEYTVSSADPAADGSKTMTVTVNDAHEWHGTKLWIVYKATVNEQAARADAVMLSNSAKVKHNATADSALWSEAGMTKQYVGSFNFTKVGPDSENLKNAEFAVYSGTKAEGTPLKFTKVTGEGDSWTYYYNPKGQEDKVVSDANGRVVIYGLKAKMTSGVEGDGKYTLKETQAPTGYLNVESTMPVFTVEAQLNNVAGTLTATTNLESDNNTLNLATSDTEGVKVKNVKSITQLPLTGGAGIILFSVIAALLIAVAAIVTVRIRSVKRELQD